MNMQRIEDRRSRIRENIALSDRLVKSSNFYSRMMANMRAQFTGLQDDKLEAASVRYARLGARFKRETGRLIEQADRLLGR